MKQHGPIDDAPWPEELTGHVVARGDAPRVHGYDVQGDLAVHYRFGETLLVYLTGEAPDADTGRAFEIAMTFASVVDAGEAPAHAAIVARMCGAAPGGVVSVAATALAERHRALVGTHARIFEWSRDTSAELPAECRARDDADRSACARLAAALPAAFASAPVFSRDPSLDAALLATLVKCGLSSRERAEAALTIAGLACACAEAFATKPGDFRSYPMNSPPFEYEP